VILVRVEKKHSIKACVPLSHVVAFIVYPEVFKGLNEEQQEDIISLTELFSIDLFVEDRQKAIEQFRLKK